MEPITNPHDIFQSPPPIPARPLEYVQPKDYRRPGIITAIGVMSIIVASLGMVFNLLWLLQTAGFFMMTRANFGAPTIMLSTGPVKPEDEFVGPAGLSKAQRQEVMYDVAAKAILNPAREARMHELLAEHGKVFTSVSNTSGQKEQVDLKILKAEKTEEGPEAASRDILTLETGMIEISDSEAIYLPANGPPMRVSAGGSALSDRQTQAVIDLVNTTSGTPLNPAQEIALASAVQSPYQQIFAPSLSMIELLGQLNYALVNNGTLTIFTDRGTLDIDASGKITDNLTKNAPPGVNTMANNPPPFANFDTRAIYLAASEGVVSLLLAVLLLIAAIFTLRQSRPGLVLHRVYIWTKIPLAIIAAIATAWMYYELFKPTYYDTGAVVVFSSSFSPILIASGIIVVLGLLYPISLLVVFSRRSVRDYYSMRVATS